MRPILGAGVTSAGRLDEWLSMERVSERAMLVMSGVEPRDEHDLRIWTPIAMWLAGSLTIGVGTVLPDGGRLHVAELRGLVAFGLLAAAFTFLVFRPVSNRTLYVLTNIFTALGSVTVWLACLWSGGAGSVFLELYFFPALYVAYFFRVRQAVCQLVFITVLAVSPLMYDAAPLQAQFPGHLTVLLAALWGMAAVVGYRKRRLLLAEQRSRRQAMSDPLTGLFNLRALRDRVALCPPGEGTGVLVIDIDDFKEVNTAYGHTGADELLRQVGMELTDLTDGSDCVARIGGDEFALLVSGRSTGEVERLAGRCEQAVRDAASSAGLGGPILSGSVGFAMWPEDGRTLPALLAAADEAMFRAKAGRGPIGEPAVQASPAPARATRAPPRSNGPAVAGPRPRLVGNGSSAGDGTLGERERRTGGWWGRPPRAIAAAAAWLGSSAITLIVILLPGADTAHTPITLALIAWSATVGMLVFLWGARVDEMAYRATDALAAPGIAFGVYLTGGTTSPLLPLVFLAVALAAYFSSSPGAVLRLVGAVAVCASPFLYSTADAQLLFILRFVALASTAGVLVGIILYNKRQLAQAEQVARELASHDALTGLPNRRAFTDTVGRTLQSASRPVVSPMSIAMIDLDNFKRVNDMFGHAAGDTVLQAIAAALHDVTRPGDFVARIGGDEFALVAHGVDTSVSRAISVRCVSAVEAAVAEVGYSDCAVSATVGFALFPYHGTTLDQLVEAADSALMDAKDGGKRRVCCAATASTA
jgi:diguanylate cyclase (GGDEF)-like protein